MEQTRKNNPTRSQGGFTLIEIIAVLVILGILAAVAVPKFIDLQDSAAEKAVQGVAGNMGSASALNFAASLLGADDVESVGNCSDIANLLDGGIPDGYSVTAEDVTATNSPVTCTVEHDDTEQSATFQIHFVAD